MKNVFLLVLLLAMTRTFACSCARTAGPLSYKVGESFSKSDLIITGKVVDIEDVKTGYSMIYTFEVTEMIKGEAQKKTIEIISNRNGASCGYVFKLGQSYLVYARMSTRFTSKTNNDFDFTTSLCSRNQQLQNLDKKELRMLNKLKDETKG